MKIKLTQQSDCRFHGKYNQEDIELCSHVINNLFGIKNKSFTLYFSKSKLKGYEKFTFTNLSGPWEWYNEKTNHYPNNFLGSGIDHILSKMFPKGEGTLYVKFGNTRSSNSESKT